MFKSSKNPIVVFLLAAIAMAAGAVAMAGTGGTEFVGIVTTLTDWAEGGLGRTIILAMFLTGIAIGVLRQSLMAAVVGIAGALVVNYGPGIITSSIAAALPQQ